MNTVTRRRKQSKAKPFIGKPTAGHTRYSANIPLGKYEPCQWVVTLHDSEAAARAEVDSWYVQPATDPTNGGRRCVVKAGTIRRMRTTPELCRRDLDCQPLHAVVANDESSFVCSGMPEDHVPSDEIRLCFVTPTTDTMYDHDENDLLDLIEVISRGMSTKRRLEQC